jgi:hypothetical protein
MKQWTILLELNNASRAQVYTCCHEFSICESHSFGILDLPFFSQNIYIYKDTFCIIVATKQLKSAELGAKILTRALITLVIVLFVNQKEIFQ